MKYFLFFFRKFFKLTNYFVGQLGNDKMNEEKNLYKIDLFQTLLANFINLFFLFFIFFMFFTFAILISSLETEVNKLLGILIIILGLTKVVTWCIRPQFVYRPIKSNDVSFKRKEGN